MTRKSLSMWALLPAALALPSAQALTASTVPSALPSITVWAGSPSTGTTQVDSNDFGIHQAAAGSAQVQARVGSDTQGVPFMSFSGSASTGSYFGLAGTLEYYWTLQGDASAGPVPVTITTLGNIQGSIKAQSLVADRRVEVTADYLGMKIVTYLDTYEGSGSVQRSDGLRTGGIFGQGPGQWLYPFGTSDTSDPGGEATASGSGSFSRSFEMLVTPNAINRIVMQIGASLDDSGRLSNNPSAVSYSFDLSGYIDPVITVDAAFANSYSVQQSAIPMTPVPEAPVVAMMLSGLAVLAGVVRSKK